ncbi:MAG: hypothetical protein M3458_01460 [Acidobacteriota bacterium]|nr:hypothetical protein [Acidobacteriota bacterium]
MLATILDHEGTPAEVCDYITDVVLEPASTVNIYTPATKCIDAISEGLRGTEEKGMVRCTSPTSGRTL